MTATDSTATRRQILIARIAAQPGAPKATTLAKRSLAQIEALAERLCPAAVEETSSLFLCNVCDAAEAIEDGYCVGCHPRNDVAEIEDVVEPVAEQVVVDVPSPKVLHDEVLAIAAGFGGADVFLHETGERFAFAPADAQAVVDAITARMREGLAADRGGFMYREGKLRALRTAIVAACPGVVVPGRAGKAGGTSSRQAKIDRVDAVVAALRAAREAKAAHAARQVTA